VAGAAPAANSPAPAASSPAAAGPASGTASALVVGGPASTPANPVTITNVPPVGGSIANIDPVALELLSAFAGTGPTSNVPMLIAASSLAEDVKKGLLDTIAGIASELTAVTVGNRPALRAAAAKIDKLADDLAALFPNAPANSPTNPLNVIAQNLSNSVA
jgi:hypothetical protein